jgi:hypothetical protein
MKIKLCPQQMRRCFMRKRAVKIVCGKFWRKRGVTNRPSPLHKKLRGGCDWEEWLNRSIDHRRAMYKIGKGIR